MLHAQMLLLVVDNDMMNIITYSNIIIIEVVIIVLCIKKIKRSHSLPSCSQKASQGANHYILT